MTDYRETISIDDVVKLLNELVEIDRPAIAALIANRVPCNQALADHSTIQVVVQHGGFSVGLMGIINGLFGVYDDLGGPIGYVFEDDPSGNFPRLTGFKRMEEKSEEGTE